MGRAARILRTACAERGGRPPLLPGGPPRAAHWCRCPATPRPLQNLRPPL